MNSKHTLPIFYFLILSVRGLSDEAEWSKFKATYGRTYDAEEDRFRFEIFRENLREILEHNEMFEAGATTCRLGINKFADFSREELGIPYHVGKTEESNEGLTYDQQDCYNTDRAIPDEFDWRTLNAVTEVKDQRDHYEGYSWAFAVVAALETQVYLAIKTLVPLSAQQLIDCIELPLVFWGTFMDYVYTYVMKMGILTEDEYPYTNSVESCRQNETGIYINMLTDMFGECGIKESVVVYGPVTTTIDALRLHNYESGIVDSTLCSNDQTILNHTVLIVGYGNANGVRYWIARNSWGPDWGEDGYFRIARLANNTCGVGSRPSFPYITRDNFNVSST